MGQLRVASWNVLAACWASPRWYPGDIDIACLDRVRRRALINTTLQQIVPRPDVVCLQEVTETEFAFFANGFGPEFIGTFAGNARGYWSHWLTDDVEWEPNGPALFVRRDAVADVSMREVALSDFGNRAAWVDLVDHDGRRHTIVSIHLDADDATRRGHELDSLLSQIDADSGGGAVVIAGDFNADTVDTPVGEAITSAGFVDALTALGNHSPTHPFARPSDAFAAFARIDHILVRGARPVSAHVVDAGVWDLESPHARLSALVCRTGTDHLALCADIDVNAECVSPPAE